MYAKSGPGYGLLKSPEDRRAGMTPPATARQEPAGPVYQPRPQVTLNDRQREVYDHAVAGRNVFFTGPAGCGKSTLIKVLVPAMQDQGKRVRMLAPTGMAAYNIGGSTIHSYLSLGQNEWKKSIAFLEQRAKAPFIRQRMKDTDVIFIDEVSMVEHELMERLDRMLRSGRGSFRPFGGVQLVVSGDFCQLGPVQPFKHCLICGAIRESVDSGTRYRCKFHGIEEATAKWAFCAPAWEEAKFRNVFLSEVHRQTDGTFKNILFKLWLGKQLTSSEQRLLLDHEVAEQNPIKLFSTKREVQEVNVAALRRLRSLPIDYSALDDFHHNEDHRHLKWKSERSKTDEDHLLAHQDHRYEANLRLKTGTPVVLLVNLDVGKGLVNGSQGIVTGFRRCKDHELPISMSQYDQSSNFNDDRSEQFIAERIPLIGTSHSLYRVEKVRNFMDRIAQGVWPVVEFQNGITQTIYANCDIQELGDTEPYSLLTRTQIPLHAAWALTIHKSQGMTLPSVEVDISKTFEQGQVYVALSRCPTLAGLTVKGMRSGYACGSGHEEVHQWLAATFNELRAHLEDGRAYSEDD